jgi:hypothetical protein
VGGAWGRGGAGRGRARCSAPTPLAPSLPGGDQQCRAASPPLALRAGPGPPHPRVPASPRPRCSKMTLKSSEGEGGGSMRTALSDLYLEHLLQKRGRPEVSGPPGPPGCGGWAGLQAPACAAAFPPSSALFPGVLPPRA